MPYSAIVWMIPQALRQVAYEQRLEMMADDDGMPPPYIKLDAGINEPRALSWAEERALRLDLELSIDPVACRPGRPVYRFPLSPHVRAIWGDTRPDYRNDLVAFARDFWSQSFEPPFPKATMKEWQEQYLQHPKPPEPDYDAIAQRNLDALRQSMAQRKQEYLDSPEFGELFDRVFNHPEKP